MSITVKTETVNKTIKTRYRTYEAFVQSQLGGPTTTSITRQEVKVDQDGNILSSKLVESDITRDFADVAKESVTLSDGIVLTHAQVDEAKAKFSDLWHSQDIAKEEARLASIEAAEALEE